MKYTRFTLCLISFLLLFSGCKKESVNSISVTAKPYNGSSKAYVNSSHYLCWNDGDAIRLIGGTSSYDGQATISISHPEGYASGSATTSASGYSHNPNASDTYAAYPWSVFSGSGYSMSDNVLTFNMPSSYNYEEVEGHQVLSCPMVAKTVSDVLTFTNLCSLIELTVPAPTSGAFVIDQIQVVATRSPLSGTATVDVSAVNPAVIITGTGNTITMNFASDVPLNSAKTFYIPIPPLANGASLTIKVRNKMNMTSVTKALTASSDVPGNNVISIAFVSTDAAALNDYDFYNWLYNHTSGSSARINLGEYLTATTKTEITFVQMADPTANQGYTGARQNASPNKVYYAITGFTHGYDNTNSFAAQFMGESIVTNGGNETPGGYNHSVGFNTTTQMSRVVGTKYRHTFEVKSDADGYYYGDATFEQLDHITSEVGCNNSIITGRTKSTTWDDGCNSAPIYVFGFGPTNNPGMKLYSYRFWQNGSLSHNFVPAIKHCAGNVDSIGVLNMVTNVFIRCDKAITYGGTTGSYFSVGND